MAEITYTRGPLIAGGQFGSNTPGFHIFLRLNPEEQAAITKLCPPEQPVDLATVFTTVDFLPSSVSYQNGNELAFVYIGGRGTRTADVATLCKRVVEEKLNQQRPPSNGGA